MRKEKKTNYEIAIRLLALVGFICFLGAVGNCDYTAEFGGYYSIKDMIKQMGIGIILMLPFFINIVKENL